MNLSRRLLTPVVSARALRLHERALFAYNIWTLLPRQFEFGSLLPDRTSTHLEPVHAIRDSLGVFRVFAAFATYQSALVEIGGGAKARISVLNYTHLNDDDIEVLALECLLDSIELGSLDRKAGLESLRRLLDEEIDKRTLRSLFGTTRLSRKTFARLAGVSVGALKTQRTSRPQDQPKRPNARQAVVKKLSS